MARPLWPSVPHFRSSGARWAKQSVSLKIWFIRNHILPLPSTGLSLQPWPFRSAASCDTSTRCRTCIGHPIHSALYVCVVGIVPKLKKFAFLIRESCRVSVTTTSATSSEGDVICYWMRCVIPLAIDHLALSQLDVSLLLFTWSLMILYFALLYCIYVYLCNSVREADDAILCNGECNYYK